MAKIIFNGKPSIKPDVAACVLLSWLIIPMFTYPWKMLEKKTTTYKLTSKDFSHKHGVFNLVEDHLELFRVRDVRFEQPLFSRFFGLGNIILVTTDDTNPIQTLMGIPAATGKRIISELKEIVRKERKSTVKEVDYS